MKKHMILGLVVAAAMLASAASADAAVIVSNLTATAVTSATNVTIPGSALAYYIPDGQVQVGTGTVGGSGVYLNPAGIQSSGGYNGGYTGTAQFGTNGGTGPTVAYPSGSTSTIKYTVGTDGGNGNPGTDYLYIPVYATSTPETVNVIFGVNDGGNPHPVNFRVGGTTYDTAFTTAQNTWKFYEYTFDVQNATPGWTNVQIYRLTDGGNPCKATISAAWVTAPEPATMAMLAVGGIGVLLRRRK